MLPLLWNFKPPSPCSSVSFALSSALPLTSISCWSVLPQMDIPQAQGLGFIYICGSCSQCKDSDQGLTISAGYLMSKVSTECITFLSCHTEGRGWLVSLSSGHKAERVLEQWLAWWLKLTLWGGKPGGPAACWGGRRGRWRPACSQASHFL